MCGEGFFGLRIKLASLGVAFDRVVELRVVEGFKPRAKPRELARGKLFDGFFDVFGSSYVGDIAFASDAGKGADTLNWRVQKYERE